MNKCTKFFIGILAVLLLSAKAGAQKQTGERAIWFVEDRFGMFIHWGAYSGAEGVWKGYSRRSYN